MITSYAKGTLLGFSTIIWISMIAASGFEEQQASFSGLTLIYFFKKSPEEQSSATSRAEASLWIGILPTAAQPRPPRWAKGAVIARRVGSTWNSLPQDTAAGTAALPRPGNSCLQECHCKIIMTMENLISMFVGRYIIGIYMCLYMHLLCTLNLTKVKSIILYPVLSYFNQLSLLLEKTYKFKT